MFVLLIFSFPLSLWLRWFRWYRYHAKQFSIMARFCLKNRRFDGKRRTKSMSAGNHSEALYWLEDSADRSFILAWCRSICPKGYPLNKKLYDPTYYFLRYCYLNHYAGWIRDRHTILLGDAFKGRNDPAVGSTNSPFFLPSCSAALVLWSLRKLL